MSEGLVPEEVLQAAKATEKHTVPFSNEETFRAALAQTIAQERDVTGGDTITEGEAQAIIDKVGVDYDSAYKHVEEVGWSKARREFLDSVALLEKNEKNDTVPQQSPEIKNWSMAEDAKRNFSEN